jgi:hypothetical protein
MKPIEISIRRNGIIETAIIECDRKNNTLTFTMLCGLKKTYTSYDFYECFGILRAEFPEIQFLCKGARLDVHTSRMSSQMSSGLVAYQVRTGHSTEEEDIVRIFDYDDEKITNSIQDQRKHYKNWIESLRNNSLPQNDE